MDKRLVGLDVMRGITMAVMLVVDELGDAYPQIGHAPWNGLHLADLVMPYFLLISGISASISLSHSRFRSALGRVLRLFLLGVAVQGSIFHVTAAGSLVKLDLSTLRWMGILQRIALVFLIVLTVELLPGHNEQLLLNPGLGLWILRKNLFRWLAVLLVMLIGGLLTYIPPPKDWPGCLPASAMASSQVHGERLRDMGCSGCGWLDSLLLGVDHLYIRGSSNVKLTDKKHDKVIHRVDSTNFSRLGGKRESLA